MEHLPGAAPGATAWEQLLMECDRQGHILWMNRRARTRLGPMENLFAALPALHAVQITHLLSSRESGARPKLMSSLQFGDRPARVPIRLVRLLALENRVVLSAQVQARASDTLPSQDQILGTLLGLQSQAVGSYFRLLRATEWIEAGTTRPRLRVGAVVAEALETERARIAHELHSGANQNLAGIKLNLELIDDSMPDAPAVVRKAIVRISSLADQALSEIRSVSQRLDPPDWQRLSLAEAVERVWNTMGIPDRFHATLEVNIESDLPDSVRFTVYRAVQEGLANVYRHSGATAVKLTINEQHDNVHLSLDDNGAGFDVDDVLTGRHGLRKAQDAAGMRGIGLRTMRGQILSLNGRFEVTSSPAGGTQIQVSVPISENR